jgi:hypothetical protein
MNSARSHRSRSLNDLTLPTSTWDQDNEPTSKIGYVDASRRLANSRASKLSRKRASPELCPRTADRNPVGCRFRAHVTNPWPVHFLCHSERSEESRLLPWPLSIREVPRLRHEGQHSEISDIAKISCSLRFEGSGGMPKGIAQATELELRTTRTIPLLFQPSS